MSINVTKFFSTKFCYSPWSFFAAEIVLKATIRTRVILIIIYLILKIKLKCVYLSWDLYFILWAYV